MLLSRKHFDKTHYEVKKLGEGAFGESYLAVKKSTADQIRTKLYRTDKGSMYAELRKNLVAVKFCKPRSADPSHDSVELENEIHALTEALPAKHPRIIEAFEAFSNGQIAWLTTRYMSGGDLRSFIDRFPGAITEAFIWHIGYQAAEGLAHLFFGANVANDVSPVSGWPCMFHGDLHLGNLFLGPAASAPAFGNYPDLVLADFGESDYYVSNEQAECTGFTTYLTNHVRDLQNLGLALEELLEVAMVAGQPLASDSALLDTVDRFGALRVNGPKKVDKQGVLNFLCSVMNVADRERRRHYAPLPTNAAAAIGSEKVSDGEFEVIFCRSGSHSRAKKSKR